jgi:hypothetical protein
MNGRNDLIDQQQDPLDLRAYRFLVFLHPSSRLRNREGA